MSNLMYFSREGNKNITHDRNSEVILKPKLYIRVFADPQLSMRVLLDTHLLRFIINYNKQVNKKEKLMTKSKASFSLGETPLEAIVTYITNEAMKAEFNEISSEEFIENYLAPLDNTLRRTHFSLPYLEPSYVRPSGSPMENENAIQKYYDGNVASKLQFFTQLFMVMIAILVDHHCLGPPAIHQN